MYHLIDYIWCVEKFAQYFEAHEQEVYPLLTSPIFAYKNTRWVLNLYPEGLGDTASQGYISLFIKYVSEDPETINAKVELSLLNNKNERVYCRDTGDHQYQTFIDFGYKQFLKVQDIKDQKDDLIFNGVLKIFARVEFEHATLPSSLTWSNYDLLLFKENFKDLYETKNLCDIIVKVVKQPSNFTQQQNNNFTALNHSLLSSMCQTQSSKAKRSAKDLDSTNETALFFSNSSNTGYNNLPKLNDLNFNSDTNNNHLGTNYSIKSLETLEIKAHKFILASRSGKFRELLKTNLIKLDLIRADEATNCTQCLKMYESEGCQAQNCFNKMHLSEINKKISHLECSSSYPSCSSSSSSSTSSTNCTCAPSFLMPSTFFSSSSSTASSQCAIHQPIHCLNVLEKPNYQYSGSLIVTANDECEISDLLIIETDRSPKVIEYLIRYMYTGYLDTLDSFAKDIYEISKEYKVHGLTNLSREYIIKELNIQNCCDYLVFCVVNNDYELNNKIQIFIAENYDTIVKTNAYKQAKRKYRELFENTFNEILKKIPNFNKTHY